ncbi:uncharacterized mitochondrial protein AtMg00810-like [Nicotiana sylvestris]|uniref:uncharacterized mitochondrial protein AtMg00810-like n=1 Tax=Nicotiana sylvestris TaxID=4096 RepID=UPI00388C728B
MVIVRTVSSVAASKNWPLFQMDVNNAFLQGDLFEEVYMDLPQGFHKHGEYKFLIDQTKDSLHSSFKVKDLGELRYFLGIEVMRSKKGVLLNQRKYALELITDAGMSSCKPVATPIELNQKLTTVDYDSHVGKTYDTQLEDIGSYQRLIGKLIYLTITRPDICFAVQVLSQFMQQPKKSHLYAALREVRYIKSAPGLGILLRRGHAPTLTAFCDSDWTACLNIRRSVIGYIVKLGDSLLSWKSKK